VRYFLAVAKCGTHQAGLAAKNGVIGRVAAAAAAAGGETNEFEDVTGNAVRLFKYLVPDYYEDFKQSVQAWVRANSEVFGPGGQPQAAPDGQPRAARLQALYTQHVISNDLLQRSSLSATGGAAKLHTVIKEGEDLAAARERLETECVAMLLTELLRVDSHPTITRFFTFRGCVDRMLTMALLGFPRDGLAVKESARDISQKRLKRLKRFFRTPAACQALRRASLVLQLTSSVETFMSAVPKEGEPPTIVAIQQGKAHDIVERRLQHLLGVLHCDPDLNLAAATGALLATAGDLIARLNEYLRHPYRFVAMCRKWFPGTFRYAITKFLQTPEKELDAGFSGELQRLALAKDGEMSQRAFMSSDQVQAFLEETASALFANSLDAERAAAEVKRHEARNISLLANVSRDLMCRRFTQQREKRAAALDAAARRLRMLRRSGWQAIAWEKHDAAPEGVRATQEWRAQVLATAGPPMPATGGPSMPATSGPSMPATGCPSIPATGGQPRPMLLKSRSASSELATGGPLMPATGGPSMPATSGPSMPATGCPSIHATGGQPRPVLLKSRSASSELATGGPPMPATGGPSMPATSCPSMPATGCPSIPATGGQPRTILLQSRSASQIVGVHRPTAAARRARRAGSQRGATGSSSCQATGGTSVIDGIKDQCIVERRNRIEDAESTLDRLMGSTSMMPCTRLQWAVWVGENIEELRMRMRKDAAPHRRREFNIRVGARPGLPTGVKQFQPPAGHARATTAWGKLLEWRTGWYGLEATSGRRMFYMLRHVGTTYVIGMETHRVPQQHPYHLTADFAITDNIMLLSAFEQQFSNDVVRRVYEFHVEGEACMPATGGDSGGVRLGPTTATVIETPATYASAKKEDPEDETGDSCEDVGDKLDSDLELDEPVVDTDVASFDESGATESTESTDEEDKGITGGKGPATPDTGGHGPATSGHKTGNKIRRGPSHGVRGPTIFDNGYFLMKSHELQMVMEIHPRWLHEDELGRSPTMSKSIALHTVDCGEDRTRAILLVKAWMLWRVRNVAGWVESSEGRKRLFTEEAEQLRQDLQRFQPQRDGLMGHAAATKWFREWAPDIASR